MNAGVGLMKIILICLAFMICVALVLEMIFKNIKF